jgi:hypothetical protein
VTFDAPIGVPESFIAAVRRGPNGRQVSSFVDWLRIASFDVCSDALTWCTDAPFFRVPPGKGGLMAFEAAAARQSIKLRRRIEERTGGKSVFITAGIPGSVGSAARDIWRGLVAARAAGVPFQAWPFEGAGGALVVTDEPVIAEIYPRAAYATALVDAAPRSRMSLAKTMRNIRECALDRLVQTRWAAATGVTFHDLDAAKANEDHFDALMTAAALLRCALESLPLYATPIDSAQTEGAILGTGSIDLSLPETSFVVRTS